MRITTPIESFSLEHLKEALEFAVASGYRPTAATSEMTDEERDRETVRPPAMEGS